jgi:hypothetical protein
LSQNNLTVPTGTGLAVRTGFNNAMQSLATDFAGATDPYILNPSCAFPYMTWADTGNSFIKQRTPANDGWKTIGIINVDGSFSFYGSQTVNIPAGNVTSATVQAAINELDSKKTTGLALVQSTGYGIISGGAVTQQTVANMTIQISAVVAHMPSGLSVNNSAVASLAINAANATNPRIDLIYLEPTAGAITYLAGTAGTSPIAPTLPTGGVALATIAVAANQTTITSANITDIRQYKTFWQYLNMGAVNALYPPNPLVAAKGDGVTDDTAALNATLAYAITNNLTLIIPKTNAYYKTSNPIQYNMQQNTTCTIISNGALIKLASMPTTTIPSGRNISGMIEYTVLGIYSYYGGLPYITNNTKIMISGLNLDGTGVPTIASINSIFLASTPIVTGLYCHADSILINNVNVTNAFGEGIRAVSAANIDISNIKMSNVGGRPGTPTTPSTGGMNSDNFGDGIVLEYTMINAVVNIKNTILTAPTTLGHFSRIGILSENAYGRYTLNIKNAEISNYAKPCHYEDGNVIGGVYNIDGGHFTNYNIGLANTSLTNSVINISNLHTVVTVGDGMDATSGFCTDFLATNNKVNISNSNIDIKTNQWCALGNNYSFKGCHFFGNNVAPYFVGTNVTYDHCTFDGFGGAGQTFYTTGSVINNHILTNCLFQNSHGNILGLNSYAKIWAVNCVSDVTLFATGNKTIINQSSSQSTATVTITMPILHKSAGYGGSFNLNLYIGDTVTSNASGRAIYGVYANTSTAGLATLTVAGTDGSPLILSSITATVNTSNQLVLTIVTNSSNNKSVVVVGEID